jgi:hypothetical protein
MCLAKTDAQGDSIWTKKINTVGDGAFYSVSQTTDGGYIVGGAINLYMYLVKIDALGDTIWTKTFGESNLNVCYSVSQTTDGGYILGGNNGYYPYQGPGYSDIYIIKVSPPASVSRFPSSDLLPTTTALHVSISNHISISFSLNQPENVHISMHNMSGAKVADITNKQFFGGTHKIMLEKQKFAPGVYLVNMNTKAGSKTQSITLLK